MVVRWPTFVKKNGQGTPGILHDCSKRSRRDVPKSWQSIAQKSRGIISRSWRRFATRSTGAQNWQKTARRSSGAALRSWQLCSRRRGRNMPESLQSSVRRSKAVTLTSLRRSARRRLPFLSGTAERLSSCSLSSRVSDVELSNHHLKAHQCQLKCLRERVAPSQSRARGRSGGRGARACWMEKQRRTKSSFWKFTFEKTVSLRGPWKSCEMPIETLRCRSKA
mmetsp:Transcript_81884/g.142395  ORF Transcript_81884/g.142395 Transcript_81884/m.142395 type:complete len:222 (+) Transcript_81884:281-946(+)